MNWKIIFSLSLFGLGMAFATIYWIPMTVEPFFWIPIFVFSAWVIAQNCDRRFFLHGFLVSVLNCIFIVAVHGLLFEDYLLHNQEVAQMMVEKAADFPLMLKHPVLFHTLAGLMIGLVSGVVLGTFSVLASRLVKK